MNLFTAHGGIYKSYKYLMNNHDDYDALNQKDSKHARATTVYKNIYLYIY